MSSEVPISAETPLELCKKLKNAVISSYSDFYLSFYGHWRKGIEQLKPI